MMSSRLSGLFRDSSGNVRAKVVGIYALLIAANVSAWLWALAAFHNYPFLLGTSFLAYTFGLRHAFDADHIAAIDNVTRKLMQEGKRPVAVGLFFSLGHSTIVVGLSIAIAVTTTALQSQFDMFKGVGGVIGTLVSALFLFGIALANIFVLISIYGIFRTVKNGGRFVEEDLDLMLANRGFLARIFRRLFRMIEWSWQMYPLGFLFGLGFDTATEVCLVDSCLPGSLHGRDDVDGHDRQHPHAGGLRLGLRQANPQTLLQYDYHRRVRRDCGDRRRPRSSEPH